MFKKILVVMKYDKKIIVEIADIVKKAKLFGIKGCEIIEPKIFDPSHYNDTLVVCVGKNVLSRQFLSRKDFQNLGDEGYILRSIINTWKRGNCLILACGNRLRSDFYAIYDLIEYLSENKNAKSSLINLDRIEKSAFPLRYIYRYLPNQGLLDPFRKCNQELTADFKESALESLKRRLNIPQLRGMGTDSIIDFDKIGFPEVYGEDENLKKERRSTILEYQAKIKELISIHHQYDLMFSIWMAPLGFREDWINQNFFKAHPEVMAQLGRDGPSVNWGNGWPNRWCPSHPLTWKFIETYFQEFFRQFDIDELTLYVGDVFGVLNCACNKCKKFPYADRLKKLFRTVYQIMKRVRPRCILNDQNPCFAKICPGREVEMEKYVLEGLKDVLVTTDWGCPPGFDNFHDWRAIYDNPFINEMNNVTIRLGFEWHLHPIGRFAAQTPQVIKEQLMYAAYRGVKGVGITYMRTMDAFFWLKWEPNSLEPLLYNPRTHKALMPWHMDHLVENLCTWNPFSFDMDKFWKGWCKKYFRQAGEKVYDAFQPTVKVMDILGMWDIGDENGGGLPPFSYMDRIFAKDNLPQIAHELWILPRLLEKQAKYPQDASFYDATKYVKIMVNNLKEALRINPEDKTLKNWVRYAKGTYHLAEAFKFYHQAYFLKKRGDLKGCLANLKKALRAAKDYGIMKDYRISTHETITLQRFYIREIKSQIEQVTKNRFKPYRAKDYVKTIPWRRD